MLEIKKQTPFDVAFSFSFRKVTKLLMKQRAQMSQKQLILITLQVRL